MIGAMYGKAGDSRRAPQALARGRLSSRLVVLGLLALAAGLRWMQPGLVEYKYDEAHIASLALDVARGGGWPLLSGGTTLGLPRSAFDVYLLALPLVGIARRPEAAVWFLGSLGVLAVALTYGLGRRVGGERVAVLAGLYMACNPWLVAYDRKLWAHIQVVFSVALLWVAWEVVVAARRRVSLLFPILAALQLLSHVLALVQALSWLGALLVAPRRWAQRFMAAGVFVAALLLAPYAYALAGQGGGLNSPAASAARSAGGTERWLFARQVLGGTGLSSLVGLRADATLLWRTAELASWLVLLLALLGLIRAALWLRSPRRRDGGKLLLAWTVGPLLALAFGPLRVYPQYWTALLPLPALYVALGADGLMAGTRRRSPEAKGWVHAAGAAAVAALVLLWAASYAGVLSAWDGGAGSAAAGIPLKRWQSTLALARQWAQAAGTDQVKVVVNGIDPGQEHEPAVVASLIGSPPYARFLAPTTPAPLLLSDSVDSLYLWALSAPDAGAPLARLGQEVWQGELAAGVPPARLYRLPAAGAAGLAYTALQPPPTFDAGLQLLGYAFPEAPTGASGSSDQGTRTVDVTLFWRVLDPPAAVKSGDYTAFNHVLNDSGERVAQADGMALLSRDWWPGDILVQPYRVELPPGDYTWRVGLYSRADGRRAQVNGGSDAVDLHPLQVR